MLHPSKGKGKFEGLLYFAIFRLQMDWSHSIRKIFRIKINREKKAKKCTEKTEKEEIKIARDKERKERKVQKERNPLATEKSTVKATLRDQEPYESKERK